MPALIAAILGLIASARGGNDAAASGITQLGSAIGGLMSNVGSRQNPNLTSRGYPSSRQGY